MVGDGCQRRLDPRYVKRPLNSQQDEKGLHTLRYFKNKTCIENVLLYLAPISYILGFAAERRLFHFGPTAAPGRLFGLHLLWAHGTGWGCFADWFETRKTEALLK